MIVAPASIPELQETLRQASARRHRVEAVDLSRLDRLIEHVPEDMTVTGQAGLTLEALQTQLGARSQWLPLDPPDPAHTRLADLIARNLSGPMRLGFGPVREHLIGLRAVLADGRLIHSGGKVVKNVAGYDLLKLFVGSGHSLGVVVEAAFKVRPLPETTRFLELPLQHLDQAEAELDRWCAPDAAPVVLDLHRFEGHVKLALGFAGADEDVNHDCQRALTLKYQPGPGPTEQDWFWRQPGTVRCFSVLPSKVIPALRALGERDWLCRAGDGLIYHRGESPILPPRSSTSETLYRRLKAAFDPHSILPECPR